LVLIENITSAECAWLDMIARYGFDPGFREHTDVSFIRVHVTGKMEVSGIGCHQAAGLYPHSPVVTLELDGVGKVLAKG
jgi:hypothetical protein